MHIRFSRFAALAVMLVLAVVFVSPSPAAPTASERAQLVARMRALKKSSLLSESREGMRAARAFAYQKKYGKFPRGFSLTRAPRETPDFPARTGPARQRGSQVGAMSVTSFPANVRANNPAADTPPGPGNGFLGSTQSETSIAAYGNKVVITWNDGEGFNTFTAPNYQLLGYGYSTDGGDTWTDGGTIPIPVGSPKWEWSSDPVLTVNEATGEFFFAGLVFSDGPPPPDGNGTHNGIAVIKGSFSGSTFTWGVPTLCFEGSNSFNGYDKEWLAVDPTNGYLYLSYTNFTTSGDQIEVRRSIDNNVSWSAPQVLSDVVNDNGYVQGSRVAVGNAGEVYVVWQAIGFTDADYFKIRKSTNNGGTYAAEQIAVSYYANIGTGAPGFNREKGVNYPAIAVDHTNGPFRGRVYLAWNESVNWYTEYYNGVTVGNSTEPEGVSASGVNDTPASATSFNPGTPGVGGNRVRGWIGVAPTSSTPGDVDFFKFNAVQGTTYIFMVDSINVSLNMAFRVICSDGTTRLAFSAPGPGFGNIIVWTAPSSGIYYMRPAAISGSGYYSIRTFAHVPNPPPQGGSPAERGRDQRDIFVSYSDNGYTGWSNPTLVNDDSPYFDNWLPEIAVTGNSRVFTGWYDWRDSGPPLSSKCGGQSGVYVSRSDDGGSSWSSLGAIADAESDWTTSTSNVRPNQGDYISLFANASGLYPAWADARDGDPNIYTVTIPITTQALASLQSATTDPGNVVMVWLATDFEGQVATLQRKEGAGGYSSLGTNTVSGGLAHFTDITAADGVTYTYRLAFGPSGTAPYSREAIVTVRGSAAALSLSGARPNPVTKDAIKISFALPSAAPATITVVDIRGRKVASQEVGSLGGGPHVVTLNETQSLRSGVYIVALRQGGRTVTTRVSVVR